MFRNPLWVVPLISAACAPPSSTTTPPSLPTTPLDLFYQDTPLVIAHQGGKGLGPEHTLHTSRLGVAAGTDVLELDVHTTADGHVVVIHDDTVDDTTNGTGRVLDFTLAELQALDAGYHWSPDGGVTFPERGQGHVIPTMVEVFEAFPDAWYVIEIKQAEPPMVTPFLSLLEAHGLAERTVVASFHDEVIQRVRTEAPHVLTSFGEDEATEFKFLNHADRATYEPPADVLQLPPTAFDGSVVVIDETLIANARFFGLPVHAWTINERSEMDALLALGVNGLITDWPDRARAAVDALPASDP